MCHKLGIIDCLQKLGVFLGLSLSLLEYFEFVEITFSVSINRINVKINQNSPQKFDFTVNLCTFWSSKVAIKLLCLGHEQGRLFLC